jgi:hypothetical protein
MSEERKCDRIAVYVRPCEIAFSRRHLTFPLREGTPTPTMIERNGEVYILSAVLTSQDVEVPVAPIPTEAS